MGKFNIYGTIINAVDKTIDTRGGGQMNQTILIIEETTEGRNPVTYKHDIFFSGYHRKRIPPTYGDNNTLIGMRVLVLGTLASSTFNGKNYPQLRGEDLMVISKPVYEDKQPQQPQEDTQVDYDKNVPSHDDDIPF